MQFFGLSDSNPSASTSWWCSSFTFPPLFLKMVADIIGLIAIIAEKLSLIVRGLLRLGSYPECWRFANVTAIPKDAPSPDRENYNPISITSILS